MKLRHIKTLPEARMLLEVFLINVFSLRKRQDSNLRTALGRSTVFEAASFSHSDTLPCISGFPSL